MSSPSRMLRGRPTAPLPTQYASNSVRKNERRVGETERGSPTCSGQPKASSTHRPEKRFSISVDLPSEDSVREYLRLHKNFLEEFILEDVPRDILERIFIRKAQRNNPASGLEETLGYEIPKDVQEHLPYLPQKQLLESYKQLTKLLLESQPDCKAVLQIIDDTVTKVINADRTALFLVDSEGKNLYAQIFTVSKEEEVLVTLDHLETTRFEDYLNQLGRRLNVVRYKGSNVAISIDKGVVGYTARTGKLQNVTDVKKCPYFCTEVDEMTGYTTKTLLCAPLITQGRVLGVLEAVNKKDGVFSEADVWTLQSLAEFCCLLVTHCRMKEEFTSIENQFKVAQEILAYHRPCSEERFQEVKAITLSTKEEKLVQGMSIDTTALSLDKKVQLVLTMFTDLVNVSNFEFDLDQCLRFALTVARNYRNEEYHNWDHAFSVAHCMYWILKGAPQRFSELEKLSLFWGCLCHDLDHRGHNNTFLVKTGAPLAKLYSSSILENHHFSQALALLQLEGHNIFSCLTTEQHKEVLTIMQKAILATDLVRFFGNKDQFSKIINSGEFSWDVPKHRELVFSLMMTASDLCSSCKPWEKHKIGVMALFEEFHNQGDKEKALGLTPLEMMDRNFKHTLPSCQVGFLRSIACPCSELLLNVLPHAKNLLGNAQHNLEMWEKVAKETATN